MAIGSRVSGEIKSASGLFAKVNGGWKKAQFGYVKVNDTWKQFWADKLEDSFSRVDTTSGLGSAESGQGWSVLRSQWQINSNNAKTTGAKTDYPLANIDLGFNDFTIEANELAPGMGVAVRVTDANNWIAVVPFYNQTATAYSYCVDGYQQQYCINIETCYYQEAICYSGTYEDPYSYVDDCCNSLPDTYEYVLVSKGACAPAKTKTTCYTETRVVCEWVYQTGRGVVRVCSPQPTRFCETVVVPGLCEPDVYQWELVPGGCDTANPCYVSGSETYCNDGDPNNMNGYSLYYPQKCGCAFFSTPLYGSQFVCTQTATGTTYNNFYYIRVVKMVDGVFSVVSDTAVNERWSGLKLEGNSNNITATAYSDSLYTNQVGTVSFSNTEATGTGYGIVGVSSNFEDGRTIGSIKVKALGQ